jgi:hypothetical protein
MSNEVDNLTLMTLIHSLHRGSVGSELPLGTWQAPLVEVKKAYWGE